MASSFIVPTFCYPTNIDVRMLPTILEIFGLLHFWVVSFTNTELSFSLTNFSCTRCLSMLPVP